MKKLIIFFFISLVIFMPSLISASEDSVTIGPYKVSFDIGLTRNDYNVATSQPKEIESLSGATTSENTIYILNKTKDHFIIITLARFNELQPRLEENDIGNMLQSVLRNDSDIKNVQMAARTIDDVRGVVSSEEITFGNATSKVYEAYYQPLFDPMHSMVSIVSSYPWDEGTLQILKTIHVERL